ncbi:MAG TPA: glycosyltransferase family 4 protein [Anaerolineales bacterium]|nr:glycosyltransferase family 4 protein [Anaerolineales bacterium]
MHILFLTQIVPFPPDAGPKVKTWHVLRYLASIGHHISLATFVRPEEERHLPAMRQVCAEVNSVPLRRSRLADAYYWLRSQITGRPFLIERDDQEGMRALVEQLVDSGQVEVIHADQLTMTQFALPYIAEMLQTKGNGKGSGAYLGAGQRPITVFDAHNAVWTIVDRMRDNAKWFLQPFAQLEAERLKRYEGLIVRTFDHTLAVTEPDRRALLQAAKTGRVGTHEKKKRITVVPIAVDVQRLQPILRRTGSHNIITLGTLHYPPNADGIRWFARQVFPLVRKQAPQATLTIVGKNPPADFLQLQAEQPEAIRVTGYVEDLKPYLEQAAVMVVAVRAGGGMRVRILEAFAQGMPVVTTTLGLQGIEALPGEEVVVADEPQDFAQAVANLLQDDSRQARLAVQGRRLAERYYDWRVVLKLMNSIYPPMKAQPAWRDHRE